MLLRKPGQSLNPRFVACVVCVVCCLCPIRRYRHLKIPASSFNTPARGGGNQGSGDPCLKLFPGSRRRQKGAFFLSLLSRALLCVALRCVLLRSSVFPCFLGKCGKGRFPVSQNFHPAQCPNPNPCVPKPKPIPMHSPQSDGSRHPGKHSPQSDGSSHCLGGMVIKNRE